MSMLSIQQIEEQASRMDEAEQSKKQVKPPTTFYPEMTIEDAYQIQNAWIEKKIRTGLMNLILGFCWMIWFLDMEQKSKQKIF